MTDQMVIEIGRNALTVVLLIAGPLLGLSLVVGLAVSIFQAVTQVNEATLTFIPKILAIFLTMAILGSWMIGVMINYTTNLFQFLPYMVR
ncbi:MAG: flagellar biosynthesis protein FliQ [Bacteroidetes bacterium]|nr:flagellar biosynthesis protein FliQ [Bacteroidota bacterium]MCL5027296.1 flagellar biosynthesis protein FliQ [Chloroflexota bacterium]